MKEKDKGGLNWKGIGWSTVVSVALYGMLCCLGAALVSGEKVGQERIGILCFAFCAIAVLVSELLIFRGVKRGRLAVSLLGGFGMVMGVVVVAGAAGRLGSALRSCWVLLLGALVGSVIAALCGGGRKKRTLVGKTR